MRTSTENQKAVGRRLAALSLLAALALVLALAAAVRAQVSPAGQVWAGSAADPSDPANAAGAREQAAATRQLRVEVTTPGSSEPAVWHFFQGAEGVAMVPPLQPPHPLNAWALVEGGVGSEPLVIASAQQELEPVWNVEEDYSEGVLVDGRNARLELRGLEWDMIRGKADRTVAGRSTRHYVVTASLKIHARPTAGLEKLGEDSTLVTSRTDLWLDPSLPFSWAPLAVWGGRSLSVGHPVADARLRELVAPRLGELGFPLRTQTRISYREYGDADFTFGQDARTLMVVTGIQPAEEPAIPSRFLRYSRSSSSQ